MEWLNKEDVDIEVGDDMVKVTAKRTQTEEEKRSNYVRKERAAQTFFRSVPLPEKIQCEETKASLNNGVLEITLPKKEPTETKKITIA